MKNNNANDSESNVLNSTMNEDSVEQDNLDKDLKQIIDNQLKKDNLEVCDDMHKRQGILIEMKFEKNTDTSQCEGAFMQKIKNIKSIDRKQGY